ncbi:MAG TPA: hypothetical protein VL485_32520 [Ktedonobacteraceae bacterium]|nr:hypothetical protein [Ktedonobacteraceae bacterium]
MASGNSLDTAGTADVERYITPLIGAGETSLRTAGPRALPAISPSTTIRRSP